MVDVGDKDVTHRVAVAAGVIRMLPETHAMVAARSILILMWRKTLWSVA